MIELFIGLIIGWFFGFSHGWYKCHKWLHPLLVIAHRDTRRFMQMWQEGQNALRKFGLDDENHNIQRGDP